VALGNLPLLGVATLEPLRTNAGLALAAELGAVLLLFEAGLESSWRELVGAGKTAALVALIGVALPVAGGAGTAAWLVPEAGALGWAFAGAALTATSVGITARVLKELGTMRTRAAHVILGAAVIDDVLGLLILAALTAASAGSQADAAALWIVPKVLVFFAALAILGPRLAALVGKLRPRLAAAFGFAALAAIAAHAAGLAPIVGAFAAGALIEDESVRPRVAPFVAALAPLFFAAIGFACDLRALASGDALLLAAGLSAVAIAGKLAAGWPARSWVVGIGMIPRGEVGLIFAATGADLHLVSTPVYGALIGVVLLTTAAAPPLLRRALAKAA
jgi:Kef-type K+ transport system membrane component KefB